MKGEVTNSLTEVGGGGAALCKMMTEHGHMSMLAHGNLPITHLYLMGLNVVEEGGKIF